MILARAASIKAEHREILHVLGQYEGSTFEHEDALFAIRAAEPKMFCKGCTERAAANDDEVERLQVARRQTGSGAGIRVDGDERFVIGVAEITSKNVAGERGGFSCEWHGDGLWWFVYFGLVEWKLQSCSGEAWEPPSAFFLILFSSCAHIPKCIAGNV